MKAAYEIYLPVTVTVLVADDGTVTFTGGQVDWEGAPWLFVDSTDNFYNPEAEPNDECWTGHGRDESNPLWDIERQAEQHIYDTFHANPTDTKEQENKP